MTYTEDEIEAAARAMLKDSALGFATCSARDMDDVEIDGVVSFVDLARAALSAVPRVPDGFWLAPDEPDPAMVAASESAVDRQCNCYVSRGYINGHDLTVGYRAMRDVVKGRKP